MKTADGRNGAGLWRRHMDWNRCSSHWTRMAQRCTTDGQYAEQSAEPVTVVSTVGAGDSFAAGYMASLLSGDPIPVSLHKAILLSSHVIQFPGALPFVKIGT